MPTGQINWVYRLTLDEYAAFIKKSRHSLIRGLTKKVQYPRGRWQKEGKWYAWLKEKEYKEYSSRKGQKTINLKPSATIELPEVDIPRSKEEAKDEVLKIYWEVAKDPDANSELKMKAAERIVKAMNLDKIDNTKEEQEDKFDRLAKELALQEIDYNSLKDIPE